MSTPFAALLFLISLAATLAASGLFARRLDALGVRLGIPEALLGLLTALAADGPELSSGLTAMVRGQNGVGVGVLIGSNLFNLAAMVGLSALLAGSVRLDRPALTLEGAFALFVITGAGGVLFGPLSAWPAVVLLAAAAIPYRVLLGRGTCHGAQAPRPPWEPSAAASAGLFARELPAVAVIIAGSVGMVYTAVLLADRVGLPRPLVGLLLLATLTSLPNAATAIRLGLRGRGEALVSETLNSNTINLSIGILIPAALVGLGAGANGLGTDYAWMAAVTVATLVLVGRRGGAGRLAGGAIVVAYLAYVVVRVAVA